jgi:hypothetical protein
MDALGIALNDEVHHQSIGLALNQLGTDARPTALMKAHGLGAMQKGRGLSHPVGSMLFAPCLAGEGAEVVAVGGDHEQLATGDIQQL